MRHEVALVEWNTVRKEVNHQQTQVCVHHLFSSWRASLVTARCEAQGLAQERPTITAPQARERPTGRIDVNSRLGFVIDELPWMGERGGWVKAHGSFPPCARTLRPRSIGSAQPVRISPMQNVETPLMSSLSSADRKEGSTPQREQDVPRIESQRPKGRGKVPAVLVENRLDRADAHSERMLTRDGWRSRSTM